MMKTCNHTYSNSSAQLKSNTSSGRDSSPRRPGETGSGLEHRIHSPVGTHLSRDHVTERDTWRGVRPKRAGQAMIFMLMALVIMVFAVMWNVDVHKILHLKSMTQNAGDASALMAARWQGITLNLVGDLNIMNAVAISEGDSYTSSAISNMQARLCYTGPMIAFAASQQAAKKNGMYRNTSFEKRLVSHIIAVQDDYQHMASPDGGMLFTEPYEGCWLEYSYMLETVLNAGIAAGPDNARFYTDRAGNHTLLNPYFYNAIAGANWCWFYRSDYDLLKDYSTFRDWDPLPSVPPNQQYMNSEIFGIGLTSEFTTLASFTDDTTAFQNQLNTLSSERGLGIITTNAMETNALWYCYDANIWSSWDAMNMDGADPFPLTGHVKDQFNYAGADAAIRISASGLTLMTSNQIPPTVTWSAAAKPFGHLNDTERPDAYNLVLPAFHEVALIPVDASSAPAGGSYDIEWRDHIENHLDTYISRGPGSGTEVGCYYCNQLVTWENNSFRQTGVSWLSTNSYLCILPGYGGRNGGGTSRGH